MIKAVNAGGQNRWLLWLGLALLVGWGVGWIQSAANYKLAVKENASFPVWQHLSCDFDCNYFAVQRWMEGGNPYKGYSKGPYPEANLPATNHLCDYPPIVLVLFSWCGLLAHHPAIYVWIVVQALTFAFAAYFCWTYRSRLGLSQVPLAFAVAVALLSHPVLFEMERGNCNSLSLLFMVAGVWALAEKTPKRDALGGSLIAVAAWVKMYPGILFFGLLAMRRWRAAGCCAVAGVVIGLASFPSVLDFKRNIKVNQFGITPDNMNAHLGHAHSLTGSWKLVCSDLNLPELAKLKPTIGAVLAFAPLIGWVSYRVFRAKQSQNVMLPYLLWLTAAGTYLPIVGNDYNLIFLPLAALAAWDRRDSMWVHFFMASALFWWLPIGLNVSSATLFYSKLIGIGVVGAVVATRANEQANLAQGIDGNLGEQSKAPRPFAAAA